MDKRRYGLAGAMREIAKQRDTQMRKVGVIPADRLEQLKAFLAAELPVETALFAAARRRDESLTVPDPTLPAAANATLIEQVRLFRVAAKPLDLLRHWAAWLEVGSLRRGYRTAAAVAATVVIASVALRFFTRGNPAIPIPSKSRPFSVLNPGPAAFSNITIFERSADQLILRANRPELASLEPSLLTINRSLPDFERPNRGLPLDLPIKRIRLDVEAVRTP